MSYALPTPPTKSRPAVVRFSVYLLWLVAALNIAGIILSFVPTPEVDQALDEFYREHPQLSQNASGFGDAFTVGVGIVLAAVFVTLAIFVGKGAQPARITVWVFGGIVALCQTCIVIGSVAAPALLNNMTTSGNEEAELAVEEARIITENTPGWLTALSVTLSVLGLLALVAVIILLATPAANEYFRKEEQVWVPPTGAGGGFPQYPPPGVPQNPGAPQVPPAPPTQPPTQPPTPPTQP